MMPALVTTRPKASLRHVVFRCIIVCPLLLQLTKTLTVIPFAAHIASDSVSQAAATPYLVTHAHPGQSFIVTPAPVDSGTAHSSPLTPQATYNGGYTTASTVRLRVGNGGAGQSGLIGALADAFIKWRVQAFGDQPFLVSATGTSRHTCRPDERYR